MLIYMSFYIKKLTCSICNNSNTLYAFVTWYIWIFGYPLAVTRNMLDFIADERFQFTVQYLLYCFKTV